MLASIIIALIEGAMPAIKAFGIGFVFTEVWNPVTDKFGALAPIFGTLATATIAMIIGVPISFGIALFITELCPAWLKRPLGIAIELLAGIPSIIYGMWGLFVLAPSCSATSSPPSSTPSASCRWSADCLPARPTASAFSPPASSWRSWCCPSSPRSPATCSRRCRRWCAESAYGLGATTWEVVRKVVLPYTRVGVVGGVMLGLGRALGETMAVTFVIGNAHRIGASLFAPGTTISASIANEFTEAVGDLYTSSLIALGLILFVITFTVLAIAKIMLIRLHKRTGA